MFFLYNQTLSVRGGLGISTPAYVHGAGFSVSACMNRVRVVVRILGQGGWVRRAIAMWIAGAVVTYLVAVYSLFGLSVTLARHVKEIKQLAESNTIIELNLRQKQTEFARDNESILQSMEKISDMKYVGPAETAMSRADRVGTRQ